MCYGKKSPSPNRLGNPGTIVSSGVSGSLLSWQQCEVEYPWRCSEICGFIFFYDICHFHVSSRGQFTTPPNNAPDSRSWPKLDFCHLRAFFRFSHFLGGIFTRCCQILNGLLAPKNWLWPHGGFVILEGWSSSSHCTFGRVQILGQIWPPNWNWLDLLFWDIFG